MISLSLQLSLTKVSYFRYAFLLFVASAKSFFFGRRMQQNRLRMELRPRPRRLSLRRSPTPSSWLAGETTLSALFVPKSWRHCNDRILRPPWSSWPGVGHRRVYHGDTTALRFACDNPTYDRHQFVVATRTRIALMTAAAYAWSFTASPFCATRRLNDSWRRR